MATITSDELGFLRRQLNTTLLTQHWDKAQVNTAFQAVEDRFEAVRQSFGVAIENAVPGVFSNQEKQKIVKWWFTFKFDKE